MSTQPQASNEAPKAPAPSETKPTPQSTPGDGKQAAPKPDAQK
jgi:hypothetical protein